MFGTWAINFLGAKIQEPKMWEGCFAAWMFWSKRYCEVLPLACEQSTQLVRA